MTVHHVHMHTLKLHSHMIVDEHSLFEVEKISHDSGGKDCKMPGSTKPRHGQDTDSDVGTDQSDTANLDAEDEEEDNGTSESEQEESVLPKFCLCFVIC